MSESTEQVQTADRLWEEHRHEPFPDNLRRATFGGTHLWLLELEIAGCVLRWLDNGGSLDSNNSILLQSCIKDLDRVILYCQRLHQLAVLVSRNLPSTK
ncbi:hypothetical protein ACF1G0_30220 [Streptomyces sp. NPDC013953]|uniref:hypothetical protein n=1 Tax=Streptomyces sp. NPDC013953 TaxID=3364868 RepID=UPI0036F61019